MLLEEKHGLESSDKWYEHTPADVVEDHEVELYWNLTIQTDMTVAHNGPDIILVEKAIRKWTIIDIVVPGDFNVVRTEDWKVEKYQDLEFEVSLPNKEANFFHNFIKNQQIIFYI